MHVSQLCEHAQAVDYAKFYNEALNMAPAASLEEDHANWSRGERFSFCRHPFLYGPAKKAKLLHLENLREQHLQLYERVISHLFTGGYLPHMVLQVWAPLTMVMAALRSCTPAVLQC